MSPVPVIARLRDAGGRAPPRLHRRAAALTAPSSALYGLGVWQVFRETVGDIQPPLGIDPKPFAGATIFGLSMFATLFLGVVLASS